MGQMETVELDRHRHQIVADIGKVLEKYRSVFGWDVPEVDQAAADKLIVHAMRQALDDIERNLGA